MDILKYLSQNIQNVISSALNQEIFNFIEEIRLRANQKIIIKLVNREIILDYIVRTEDLLKTIEKLTENSIYTYQNQICNGFITVKGGHRVGITGNVAELKHF